MFMLHNIFSFYVVNSINVILKNSMQKFERFSKDSTIEFLDFNVTILFLYISIAMRFVCFIISLLIHTYKNI